MTKLKGNSSLTIDNAPKPKKEEKMGLIENEEYVTRTFRLTIDSLVALEDMQKNWTKQMRAKLSLTKTLEIVILFAEGRPLSEILEHNREID